jgi:hypothetical protein
METPAPINHQEALVFGCARAQHPTTCIAWQPLLSYVIVRATNTDSQQLENEKTNAHDYQDTLARLIRIKLE